MAYRSNDKQGSLRQRSTFLSQHVGQGQILVRSRLTRHASKVKKNLGSGKFNPESLFIFGREIKKNIHIRKVKITTTIYYNFPPPIPTPFFFSFSLGSDQDHRHTQAYKKLVSIQSA